MPGHKYFLCPRLCTLAVDLMQKLSEASNSIVSDIRNIA